MRVASVYDVIISTAVMVCNLLAGVLFRGHGAQFTLNRSTFAIAGQHGQQLLPDILEDDRLRLLVWVQVVVEE